MGEFMNVFTGLECFIEILLLFLYKVICFGSVESEFNFWLKLFQIRVKNLLGCVVHITAKIILVFTSIYVFQFLKEVATTCLFCK